MKNGHNSLERLVISEISDFTAGLGQPGAPETPEEIHKQLMARVRKVFADVKQQTQPARHYEFLSFVGWVLIDFIVAVAAVYGLFWVLWDALK